MRSSRGAAPGVATMPLTIVCGPSSAGSVSLLLQLVTRVAAHRVAAHRVAAHRVAAVFADIASVTIDPAIVGGRDGDMVLLANGSICCGTPGECDETLMRLAARDPRPEHVVVEAGISPRRAKGYAYMPGYRPDGVVAVVDADSVRALANDANVGEAIRDQLSRANVVVLNKAHTVSRSVLAESHRWLHSVAPHTRIIWSGERGVASPLLVGLGRDGHGDDAVQLEWSPDYVPQRTNARGWAKHSHDGGDYAAWRLRAGAVGAHEFRRWVSCLPSWIVRGNGTVTLREMPGSRHDFDLFGHEWRLQPRRARDEERADTRVLLIGLSPEERPLRDDAVALGPIGRGAARRETSVSTPPSSDAARPH